ncbi:MAG: SulP family inorganic anion transporter [Haliangiales bacterium]
MGVDAATSTSGFPVKDLKSGFLVFLIALPLCLGIAMASGFPPVAGVLTAIIGGVIVTLLGSARLTIKGPAAGLIVIAIGAVQELGQGDLVMGYKRALAVGVIAACIQILFALLRAATIGVAMSPSVVHGMLAAIGVIIISKQAHTMVGVAPEAKGPLALLAEIPHSLLHANPAVLAIGGLSLILLFCWPLLRFRWAKLIPAPIVVLLLVVPLGMWLGFDHAHEYQVLGSTYEVGPEYLVQLPGSLLDAIAFPDFSVVFSLVSLKYVVMFALVGTIESTLSVLAVDAMDPKKEASDLNRDLLALSVGNLIAALVGGLPMISEIVRSKANIDAGAQTRWSNFSHGAYLLIFIALLPGLLGKIPLAALAAMLVYTGVRLASPSEFVHAKQLGIDQLALFLVTLVVTLASDLLLGVATGLALKVVLHLARGVSLRSLFRSKVEVERSDEVISVTVHGAATFMALLSVRRALVDVPETVREVRVELADTSLVDHTFLSRLESMSQEWSHARLNLCGLESFSAASEHRHAARRKVAS